MLVKYRGYHCPGRYACPHIHDIQMSCRYVADAHNKPNRVCVQVVWKNRFCIGGHDFETARQHAKDMHFTHWRYAENLGAVDTIRVRKQW